MLIPVGQNGTQLLQLQDITSIRKGYITPASQIVKVNGRNAISIHVNLTEGSNIIALGDEVNRVTDKWITKLPVGLELSRLSSMDSYIDNKINDLWINALPPNQYR